jgi:hypothetical protein
MRIVLILLLLFATSAVRADSFYKLVGYTCDPRANRLVVTYDAAANSAGYAMMSGKSITQWDPWNLLTMKDEVHIKSVRTIVRKCRLSDGIYTVSLGPVPGNWNLEGRCGAWMSAWAEVRRGTRVIYAHADFEQGVGCFYTDGNIITRVEVQPKQHEPRTTSRPAAELLSGT